MVKQCKNVYASEDSGIKKAVLGQKFLALLFYTDLPPRRSKEYQSLHFMVKAQVYCIKLSLSDSPRSVVTSSLQTQVHKKLPSLGKHATKANMLHIDLEGDHAFLYLSDYKTKKFYNDDLVSLDDHPLLLQQLKEHILNRKAYLCSDPKNSSLFVVSQLINNHFCIFISECSSTCRDQVEVPLLLAAGPPI